MATTEEYRNKINAISEVVVHEPEIVKMRDSISEGIKTTGNRQADVEKRQDTLEDDFVKVQQDSSSTSPSGAEVAVARGDYSTLDGRLTEEERKVAAQLAQTKPLTSRVANASSPLQIETYDGSNQPVHPKVLHFKNGWNGWKYWMAYTPFPYENAEKENPSIAVSNDKITWRTPNGLVNPIDVKPSNTGLGVYLSDTHLVYDKELNQLELWYRKADSESVDSGEFIYRKKSSDGVNWGERELLHENYNGAFDRVLSPVAIKSGSVYQIWVINRNNIEYYTSSTGSNWFFEYNIKVESEFENYSRPWHIDIIKSDLGYEMLLQMRVDGGSYKDTLMFYTKSENNVIYDTAKLLISNGVLGNFDDHSIYRASLTKELGEYTVYYTGVNKKNEWHIGVSQSVEPNNIFSLHGMDNTGIFGDLKATNISANRFTTGNSFLEKNKLKIGATGTAASFMTNAHDPIGRVQLKDGEGGKYGRFEVGSVVFKRDEEWPNDNQDGLFYYNKQSKMFDYIDGTKAIHFVPLKFGTTPNRPTGTQLKYGMTFYDTTLDKPIFYSPVKNAWVDANGNLL